MSAAAGRVMLSQEPTRPARQQIDHAPSVDRIEVRAQRLDALLAEIAVAPGSVGLVWIDVEGHEPQVVDGLGEVLSAGVPLVIEFNSRDYGAEGTQAFASTLAQHYDAFIDTKSADFTQHPVDELSRVEHKTDVLMLRSGRVLRSDRGRR